MSSDVDEWELDSKELKFDKILGEGAFGVVRKGVLTKDGQSVHVAIKMLKGKYPLTAMNWKIKTDNDDS